jgi:hypothetical protein
MDIIKEIKQIKVAVESIDVSLQLLASENTGARRTSGFVSKRVVAQRLNIPSSDGKTGLVEGIHFCKIDPVEKNSSKFLYDIHSIIHSAWNNFKNG